PGQAQIIATSGGKQGQQSITVTPIPVASLTVTPTTASLAIGATQQLTATTLDANGNTLSGRAVTWGTSDATKATVSASGLVTAIAPGTATITATSETKTGTSTITVSVGVGALASITVSPSTSTLATGGTQTFTAVGKDANGNIVVIVPAWSVVNATAGSINGSTGLFTAGAVSGTYTNTVQATSGGISGFATVSVSSSAASVTLASAGQSTTFLSSPNFAAALAVQPGSQYLVAVINTDPSNTIQEGFSLTGSFGIS